MLLIRSVVLALIATSALAQEPSSSKTKKQSSAAETPRARAAESASKSNRREVDPEVARRREMAIGSLTTLAVEARSYRDEALRARVQARVADVLWNEDPDSARTLFRRAWEAAEAFETQPPTNAKPLPGRMPSDRSGARSRPRTDLRSEVIKLAAARDHLLGEEFLRRMTTASEALGSSTRSTNLSENEIRERLRLANEFLENDKITLALQFADPALTSVTSQTISFLVALRDKKPASADQRFVELLGRAAVDADSDANTVSLLTTYAFTPWMYLVVSPEGIPSGNTYLARPAPTLTPSVRSAFFRVSANILLRPLSQLDQSSAGRGGTYFIAARLLPLFQQHAPELAPAISSQLTALGPEAAQAARNAGDRSLNRGITADTAGRNLEEDLKDRLERARNADERDRAYGFAAMQAAEAGDRTAYDYLNKIDDLETRNGIRSFVDYSLINGYLEKKKIDEAIALARSSDIGHTLRAHALTKAASLVAKVDAVRSNELLEDALVESRRIDAGTNDRAYALVSILSLLTKANRVRAWELVGETVKAGNAAPDFTGENGGTRVTVGGKFSIALSTQLADATDLQESFAALAQDDFYQAMDIGRTFSADSPRALATIAIARATLEQKKEVTSIKR